MSDFFYIWLRPALKEIFPDIFATLSTPKAEEIVALKERHESKSSAEKFFLEGMTKAMSQVSNSALPVYPITIYYAFKQTEKKSNQGLTSTGWETFLEAVTRAGFAIVGTWPMRIELSTDDRHGQ